MLIGKALHAYHHKTANMTCELSPYSCMPNTMSQGAMANVIGRYPDLLYAPIEVKGDAEVHALSRCQMILTEAKKRAHSEFEEAHGKDRIDVEKTIRAYRGQASRSAARRRTTCRITAMPATAANYVMHLAYDKGSGASLIDAAETNRANSTNSLNEAPRCSAARRSVTRSINGK